MSIRLRGWETVQAVMDGINNTIASIPAGGSVIYTINFTVPSDFTGNLIVSANALAEQADPNQECTLCTDTDYPGADLVVVNTNNQTKYTPGQTTTYTVTVTNNGSKPGTECRCYQRNTEWNYSF
ncbi:hypothetical protein [Flavobacterium sp. 3HN19-14]|uniref:hypothetical protein n=1 Tax=Flavobacterium sp. 3HN19-14 TaxID=3448133 RepID=UPI003EDF4254